MIDLHIHTTASDGSCTPAEVVRLALDTGLSAIAVTDHDTTAGIAEARAAAAGTGLRVIPGIEISADYRGTEVHVLGYFLDPDSPGLQPMLDWAVSERAARNEALASKLRDLGYAVDLDALAQENPESVIGRVHIAQALMAQGVIGSISEGFDRFFGPGKPCYVPRRHFPFQSAVDVIRNSGGLAVLAHPLQYDFPADVLHTFLADAVAAGFTGLETDYGAYSPAQRLQLRQLAVQYGLLPTGGTDFHGTHRPHIALGVGTGDLAVPDALLAALARRR
jgi:hypothetical protein